MSHPNKRNTRIINTYLDQLYKDNYRERPVSMKEFLCSDRFFGKLTANGQMVYPIWMRTLSELSLEDSKYLIAFTGSIGNGKTRAALWMIGYIMHRLLCLRRPWEFFGKASGGKMAVVFFNLTKSLGASKGYNLLQAHLLESSWFREHGTVVGSANNPRIEFSLFEFIHSSPYALGFGSIGQDVILSIMDEVDDPNESEKQRMRVLKAYNSTIRRFDSRFVRDGESLGRFFLIASKQEQLSFLNTFITKMKNASHVYVLDIPIWEALPEADYCGKKFPVMIGDVYSPSKVMAYQDEGGEIHYNEEEVDKTVRQGFKVLWVPTEYFDIFTGDIVGALRDVGGISVSYLRKSKLFPSEKLLVDCYDSTKKDPVRKLTVEIGFADDIDLVKFLDLGAIRIPRNVPRYIHIDIAFSGEGDALGIGMSCIKGWKKVSEQEAEGTFRMAKLPVVETDFGMRIHARPGDKIPLDKVRKLIIDLKNVHGFNIVLVTFDLKLMSEDSQQILTRAGIECDDLSLDRDPEIYRGFVTLVKEERWVCHRNEYLHFELVNLEDDKGKNKIDHPNEVQDIQILEDGNTQEIVMKGSKDCSDAVVGSVHNAIKNCQVLPDVEVMKELIEKSVTRPVEVKNNYWWLDEGSAIKKKEPESKEGKITRSQTVTYKDIFKKSQGAR